MCAQCTLEGEAMSRFEAELHLCLCLPEVCVPFDELFEVWRMLTQLLQGQVENLNREGRCSVEVYLCGWADAEHINQRQKQEGPCQARPGSGVLASRLVHTKDVGSLVFLVKEEDD
jgi:hypothetical protein